MSAQGRGRGVRGRGTSARGKSRGAHTESTCPSCGVSLQPKNAKRHMAFCCPDLLDPEGWQLRDRQVVLSHLQRAHKKGSPQALALARRFGATEGRAPTQQQLAAELGWSPRKVRDTISSFLHAIPPPAEHVPVEIIYEDSCMLAVSKPAGVPVSPSHRLRTGSMLNRLVAYLGPNSPVPAPVHRLDLNTSGVLVFAKQAYAARQLMSQFETRQVRKSYVALCSGRPAASHLSINDAICRVPGREEAVRRLCGDGEEGAQSARTEFQLVASSEGAKEGSRDAVCLLLALPSEGRTHQVRLHCLAAGAPMLGDPLYGEPTSAALLDRHALHALTLQLTSPRSGEPIELLSELPADMLGAIGTAALLPEPSNVDGSKLQHANATGLAYLQKVVLEQQ